jgi:Na+(H+)/acetate symporter ActP
VVSPGAWVSDKGTGLLDSIRGWQTKTRGVILPSAEGGERLSLVDLPDDGKNFGLPDGVPILAQPVDVTREGQPVIKDGKPVRTAAKLEFRDPAEVTFAAGSYIPNAQNNKKWIEPYGTLTGKHGYPLLYTFSLIIALVCGTAGLPHILVRFYTNPDGRAAKRTTFWVMILLGIFYVFTPVWGTLGRADLPTLLANNKTDSVVIALPGALENKLLGQILMGITSAGAFAAFMSTFSGLLVSMSGAFAHDVYGKIIHPEATPAQRLRAFQVAAVLVGVVAMGLGLLVESFDIALLVGWAFAIAAASYFPLLLLGSWWRGLTVQGAASGMLIGGTLSLLAIVTFMALDKKVFAWDAAPLTKALLEQPAIWGVPLSIAVMVVVSLATRRSVPPDINLKMLRLHAPEGMGLSKDYIEQ